MRVLLYAINGVGLGHVVRLSVFADRLRVLNPDTEMCFYSNSKFATQLLGPTGDTVLLPEHLSPPQRARIAYHGFERAVAKYKPEMVICDKHWPIPSIGILRFRGIRTVLILRLVALNRVESLLERAYRDFDLIVVPHSPDEVFALYGSNQRVMNLLQGRNVFIAGPVARYSPSPVNSTRHVLFSLGGGGEYHRAEPSNSVSRMLDAFHSAAVSIASAGTRCHVAYGPLLDGSSNLASKAWEVTETLDLPQRITGDTILVGRAGYNTCWEVLAAGGRLVLAGTHSDFEDVASRVGYLTSKKFAVSSPVAGDAIAACVSTELARGWDAADIRKRAGVNVGLDASLWRVLDG